MFVPLKLLLVSFLTILDPWKVCCGISATFKDGIAVVALAIPDMVYLKDFHVTDIRVYNGTGRDTVADHVVQLLQSYERDNIATFIGFGIPSALVGHSLPLFRTCGLSLTLSPWSYLRRVTTIEAPGNPSSLMNMLVEIMPLKLDLSLQSPGWTLSCGNSRLNLNAQGRTY